MKLSISRRKARERAVQILYSWQVSRDDFLKIKEYFIMEYEMIGVDISYFCVLYFGVVKYVNVIDILMKPYLSRSFNQLGYIELAVLRIAVFELLKCFDVPYKVIINEAIEVVKIFGSEKSYKFINGVLDKISIKIRLP